MAEIKQRGRNKWFVRVFLGHDPQTGKTDCACRTITGNKKDAQDWAQDGERERDMGGSLGSRATVDGLLKALKLDYRINGKDLHWAERIVRVNLMHITERRKRDEEAARSAKSHTMVTQGRPKGLQ